MKRIFLFLVAGTMALASCQDAPKADDAKTGDAVAVDSTAKKGNTYNADLSASKVEFIGTKPTGKHHGTIMLKEGNITTDAGMITGGKFVMNMTSLKTDDQDSIQNGKLTGHLSSPDFFDIAKFPEATFEISSVKSGVDTAGGVKPLMADATHTITGNLTMRGVTKSITFPAKVAITDANVTTDANFNIDRKLWEVGIVSTLDKALIKNEVNITLHVVANK